jgi:hypothetical protein
VSLVRVSDCGIWVGVCRRLERMVRKDHEIWDAAIADGLDTED